LLKQKQDTINDPNIKTKKKKNRNKSKDAQEPIELKRKRKVALWKSKLRKISQLSEY